MIKKNILLLGILAIAVIAAALDISRSSVRLVSGASSRDKVVELDGIEAGEVERRLQLVATRVDEGVA